MPQTVIPDTTRVTVLQGLGSETAVNVWHVRDTTSGVFINDSAVRTAFVNFYTGTAATAPRGINENHHEAWELLEVCTQRLTSVPYPVPSCTASGVNGLENIALALANQVAAVMSLRTGFASRRARGRIFLAGFHENAVVENASGDLMLSPAALTRIQNAVTDLDAGVNAAGGRIAVLSQLDGVSREVQNVRITNKFGTQRRRQADVVATDTRNVPI